MVAIRTRYRPINSNFAMNNWHSLFVFGKYTGSIPGSFTVYLERLMYNFSYFLQANATAISAFRSPAISYFYIIHYVNNQSRWSMLWTSHNVRKQCILILCITHRYRHPDCRNTNRIANSFNTEESHDKTFCSSWWSHQIPWDLRFHFMRCFFSCVVEIDLCGRKVEPAVLASSFIGLSSLLDCFNNKRKPHFAITVHLLVPYISQDKLRLFS